MSSNRLDILKSMVAQNPGDAFARYGLAMEYKGSSDWEGAMREFRTLIAANPDYHAAYFHGGQTLERMGREDEAREMYGQGVEAATRVGDGHARAEMQGALDLLG
ncbi:MAG: tetratricopeptide repeat protein [Bryobacteraceae bacterium]|jgi:tetratricopeptide (TPR) repeat protein